jgi:hypothetical protein
MENGDGSVTGAGAVGSAGSLGLRVGQAVFSSASLLFMSVGVEFYSYTAFWCVLCCLPPFLLGFFSATFVRLQISCMFYAKFLL